MGRKLEPAILARDMQASKRVYKQKCLINYYPSLVLVQPRKTSPYITGILLIGRKESNQNKQTNKSYKLNTVLSCQTRVTVT